MVGDTHVERLCDALTDVRERAASGIAEMDRGRHQVEARADP